MKALNTKQILFISGAVVLSVLIFILPRTSTSETEVVMPPSKLDAFMNREKAEIPAIDKPHFDSLETALTKSDVANKPAVLTKLAVEYDKVMCSALSAHYYEELATIDNAEKSWLNSAFRYFDAYRANHDSLVRPELLNKAIANYEKVIKLNPENLNAKTDLGVCYTETSQPMKGIMLLRDVVGRDPNHENAQFNLGILSIKSGQYDKAVERFKKVVEINPARTEAYLYLGEALAKTGNKAQAIENLQKYKSKSNNVALGEQVDAYIQELKKS